MDTLAGIKKSIQKALTVLYYDYYITSPEERDEDGERTSPPGIDTGIDQSMDDLSAAIDAERLEAEGADDRTEAKQEQIESFRNGRDDFVELMEVVEEGRQNISLAVGVIAIFAIVAGAASLIGAASSNPLGLAAAAVLAEAASKLALLATVLTAIVVAITAAAWLVGYNFLQTQMEAHEATVSYVANYEAQEGV